MKLAPNNRRHAPKRFRIQTTYSQAKLLTVRQSYLLSGMHPNVAADFAPNNRIHAPNRSIDMHPKGIDMHPRVAACDRYLSQPEGTFHNRMVPFTTSQFNRNLSQPRTEVQKHAVYLKKNLFGDFKTVAGM